MSEYCSRCKCTKKYNKFYETDITDFKLCDFKGVSYFINVHHIFILISTEGRPQLDIDLPKSLPQQSILYCLHPIISCDLHLQIVRSPCRGLSITSSGDAQSPIKKSLLQ